MSEPAPFVQDTPSEKNVQEKKDENTTEGFVENYYHHYPYRHRYHHRHHYYPIGTSMNMQLILIIFSLIVLFTAIMMVGLSK